jgi:hypothetical protein
MTNGKSHMENGKFFSFPISRFTDLTLDSPATHKMHDFEPIARPQFGLGPFRARQDRQIQFDRQSLRRKFELFDQIRDARARIYLTRVAVDDYFDCVSSVHTGDYAPTNHCVIKGARRRALRHPTITFELPPTRAVV